MTQANDPLLSRYIPQRNQVHLEERKRGLHIPDKSSGKGGVPGLWPLHQTSEIKKRKRKKENENKQCTVLFIQIVDKLMKNMLQTPNEDQHLRGNIEWSQAQLNWPSKKTWEINFIGPCFDEDSKNVTRSFH